MFEKVNPAHPDKIADRIAGAIVDYCYLQKNNPKVAVEVLIGHKNCHIIAETDCIIESDVVDSIVQRITERKDIKIDLNVVEQDNILANNQSKEIRCGDNGIFKGVPTSLEEGNLTYIAKYLYKQFKTDGKYIIDGDKVVICQSNAKEEEISKNFPYAKINPLGYWTGGTDVDTGATNRKLGSDMGRAVTGGGLHGKDLSKADVSVNIYAHLKAHQTGKPVELSCAIGDREVDGRPYSEVVDIARDYINRVGGFEKLAEWGLI